MQVVAVRLTAEELAAVDVMLETVVLIHESGEELVIDATPARRQYWDLLP